MTVDALFRTKMKVEIGPVTLWMRVLSDLEVQARDEYATLALARKRRALATEGSPEHERYVAHLEDESEENLRGAIAIVDRMEYWREAVNPELHPEFAPRVYPFPEQALDEEKTEILEKREAEPQRVQDLRKKWVDAQMETRTLALEAMTRAQLLGLMKGRQKDAQGRAALSTAFTSYTLYACLFKDWDCTDRVFETPELTRDWTTDVRALVANKYFGELDVLTQEQLQYFFMTAESRAGSSPKNSSAPESLAVTSPGSGQDA